MLDQNFSWKPLNRTVLCVLIRVQLFVTLRTVCLQVPLSMGFPRQEYWSGYPLPPPGDHPTCISCISWIGKQMRYHYTMWKAPYGEKIIVHDKHRLHIYFCWLRFQVYKQKLCNLSGEIYNPVWYYNTQYSEFKEIIWNKSKGVIQWTTLV